MDTRPNLESGLERSTGLEFITSTELLTKPQEDFSLQWFYNTPHAENQPVKNREHVRLLLASLNENLDSWVTFHIEELQLFTQAAWSGHGFCIVEVNTESDGWAQSVLRDGFHEINDITSDNFGNMEIMNAKQEYSTAEAFMLCALWMDRQVLPEGYICAPVERFNTQNK